MSTSNSSTRCGVVIVAVSAGLVLAGAGVAAADVTGWSTTSVEPAAGWSVTVVAPAQRAPRRPATRARRAPAVRTWRASTTCRPVVDGAWHVRRGDTMWLISRCTGRTIDQVAEASGITPGAVLRVGAVLRIPAVNR